MYVKQCSYILQAYVRVFWKQHYLPSRSCNVWVIVSMYGRHCSNILHAYVFSKQHCLPSESFNVRVIERMYVRHVQIF